jgi:hypothetical protein
MPISSPNNPSPTPLQLIRAGWKPLRNWGTHSRSKEMLFRGTEPAWAMQFYRAGIYRTLYVSRRSLGVLGHRDVDLT